MKPILKIPDEFISWQFTRAGGPGGQHVNKTSTAVELRVSLEDIDFPQWQKRKLLKLAGSRVSSEGVLLIEARDERSQKRNRESAIRKLNELLQASSVRPKRRIATKPSKASIQRRLDEKSRRSQIKKDRQKPTQP